MSDKSFYKALEIIWDNIPNNNLEPEYILCSPLFTKLYLNITLSRYDKPKTKISRKNKTKHLLKYINKSHISSITQSSNSFWHGKRK